MTNIVDPRTGMNPLLYADRPRHPGVLLLPQFHLEAPTAANRPPGFTLSPRAWLAAGLGAALIVALGLAALAWSARPADETRVSPQPPASSTAQTPRSTLATIAYSALPRQAQQVLGVIDSGGRLRYAQDGQTFGNRERRLPARDSGYYREYTVPTPGASDRGARRLVVGGSGEVYYTDDHYQTFRQVIR